jgi:hypothetical protein
MRKRTNMGTRIVAGALAVGVVVGLGLALNGVEARPSDSIGFARYTIKDWKAEGSRSLVIETTSGDRYRATFMGRCHDLPFSEAIGFETSAGGRFDKFSAVLTRDQKCPIRTLERIG